ncbi:hypothetical protein ACFO7V_05535 [Glutamicibacter bergerei]|uniref:Uncharacterized protein n=1 Tax=Glutamicibacter bergerei TaxID=256702 RepID=A0ABV9MLP8_9MICC
MPVDCGVHREAIADAPEPLSRPACIDEVVFIWMLYVVLSHLGLS